MLALLQEGPGRQEGTPLHDGELLGYTIITLRATLINAASGDSP